jgi:hypothetical protein
VPGLALAGAAFARDPDPAALERAVPCCTTLAGLPLRLEWDILVDEPDTGYLVLHTTEQALAGRSSTTTRQAIPIILPGVVTAVPGRKQGVDVAHSPDGRPAVQVLR